MAGTVVSGGNDLAAGLPFALAAVVLRDAFVATAAGVTLEAGDLKARVPVAGRAFWAVGINMAFAGIAVALITVVQRSVALVVCAAERAVSVPGTIAAELVDRAVAILATHRAGGATADGPGSAIRNTGMRCISAGFALVSIAIAQVAALRGGIDAGSQTARFAGSTR